MTNKEAVLPAHHKMARPVHNKMVRLAHHKMAQQAPYNMVRPAYHKFATGVVHSVPADLRNALFSAPAALAAWEDLTPLARNEWICWVVSVKKQETRNEHIRRVQTELIEGKRRPCCWVGCIHR